MVRHTSPINYALYQIGWFACVLGAASHRPWTGGLIGVTLIGVHLALSPDRYREALLVCVAIAVGAVVETAQIAAGAYRFTSGTVIEALPPPWLLVLWGQCATTFRFSARTVMTRPGWAALCGAAGGPIAFLAGERLGAVELLPPLMHSLLRLAVCWAIALAFLSVFLRRVTPAPRASRYRSVGETGWSV